MATNTDMIALNNALETLDNVLSTLNGPSVPCSRKGEDGHSCIIVQGVKPWPELKPEKMCQSCAAYWHIATAVNLLHGRKRLEQIMGTETEE